MTVQTNTNVASFNGNGVTQIFPIAFKFNNDTDLVVLLVDDDTGSASLLTLNSDYTVSGEGNEEGGLINVVVAPATGKRLKVTRVVDILQLTDLRNQGKIFAEIHEDALDLLTMIAQQHESGINSSLRVAESDPEPARIPAVAQRAGKILSFDANGNPQVVAPVTDSSTELRLELASSTGSGMVGYRSVTVKGKLDSIAISPRDVGAVGDGTADDTAAVQLAINSGLIVDFGGPEYSYKVTAALLLRDGQSVIGNGATLLQGTANTEILNIEGKSDIDISGLRFVGIGTDYSESDSNRGCAVYGGTGGSRIKIQHNRFENFGYAAVRLHSQLKLTILNNQIVGPGSAVLTPVTSGRCYGLVIDAGCDDVLIGGNTISDSAQGMRIEGGTTGTKNIRIIGNHIFRTVGQHGVYAGANLHQLLVAGNTIEDADLCGIKVQVADYVLAPNDAICIASNIVRSTGDQGILVTSGDFPNGVYRCKGVTVSGNTVQTTASSSIRVDSSDDVVVTGNMCSGASQSGISWGNNFNLLIDANTIVGAAQSALRDVSASVAVTLKGNVIRNCATANAVGNENGILVSNAGSDYVIEGNVISDANGNMAYGIFVPAAINGSLTLKNNVVLNATDYGLRLGSAAALREFKGNSLEGTLGPALSQPAIPVIASADAIALPTAHDAFSISGVTSISSVAVAGHSGHLVTLIFQDALTVVRGSNLLLNPTLGNFVTTANDTLTLMCNSSAWFEISRSAN
ncbi:right-handed parallel beta-helix repeat-containing protein [Stutzerimonas chloritidismutans]